MYGATAPLRSRRDVGERFQEVDAAFLRSLLNVRPTDL